MISVVIPVKNGGDDLRRCIEGIRRQRVENEVEIVVVDSGSRDGSVAVARSLGADVHEIPPADFNHGATRNLGASLAKGDPLVFTSQDAYADSDHWLAGLTEPLAEDPQIAGVYGRQIAHDEARPPERYFLDFLYGPEAREQRVSSPAELSMETTLFSNVNAAIRRSVFEQFPFVSDIIMSEDQEWSRRVLLAGWKIRYVPEASVRHSHPYSFLQGFRRFFDSGVSAERSYVAGQRPAADVLRRRSVRYARGELSFLWRTGQGRWIPYAVVYELSKFAGLQLGLHHNRLPMWAKLRFTALPSYWASHAKQPL